MDQMEQPATPDSELPDTPADSEQHEPNPADVEQEGGQEGAEQGGDEPAEEDAEIEVDGRKFVLPKSAAEKIQAERMMNAAFTQKTQALAAERAEVAKARETQHQFVKEMARVEALTDQLATFDGLNWDELIEKAPQEAMRYQHMQKTLEAERNKAVEAVTQKQQQIALDEQQAIAKQVQEAEAYVQREIKGWSADRATAVMKFAADNGVNVGDRAVAKAIVTNPALLKLLHQAEMYSQLEKKQVTKPAASAPPPPATRVAASRPGATKSPDAMSVDEWMNHRNKQIRKR